MSSKNSEIDYIKYEDNCINNNNKNILFQNSKAINFCKNIEEINNKNEKGYTPIYLSILSNNIFSLKDLLLLGANPNIPNNLGETPLNLSVIELNFDAFLLLLKYNANCNLANESGDTPLHIAVQKKEKKFIQALLKNNANPNIKNLTNGQTPTHLTIINKLDEEILQLFKIYQADIFNIKDNYNKSAFDYAKDNNDEDYINLLFKIFGYNNKTNKDIYIQSFNEKNKKEKMEKYYNSNIIMNNTDKNNKNLNLENFQRTQVKEFSNNNDYYIITTETNKNEFKLENFDSNKEDQPSNLSLIKNKIILSSDVSSENIQIKELNNTFENNSNNKSKKSLSEFLTEEINTKNNNKENRDPNSNINKNILSQIDSQNSYNSDFSKSQVNNVLGNSFNSKNKVNFIGISHTSSNMYSHKSDISGNNSMRNTNNNVYLTNSVGANKKIIKSIIRDTIKKIVVKTISSSEDNTSKENLNLFSKESEQISNTNSNMEDRKSKISKNSKSKTNSNLEDSKSKFSKNNNINENKENICSNNIDVDNNINNNSNNNNKINLYENGKNSFLLLKTNKIDDILNNEDITVSKLIQEESRTIKLSNIYEELSNVNKTNDINEETHNKENDSKENINQNLRNNLNIKEKKLNNIISETTNSNIFSELQIKSNNNYNITNNDISLSYSKNILTEEDNHFKNEDNDEKKEDKKIISKEKKISNNNIDKINSNLDIKVYENINDSIDNNINRDDKLINKNINDDIDYEDENHIREKSNGNINNNKITLNKNKSFIDCISLKKNNKYQIRAHNNSTLENYVDINENYDGENTLLKRKSIKNKSQINNPSHVYLKHYRQLSYHLNPKSVINNNKEKEKCSKKGKKYNIENMDDFNQNSISNKENINLNMATLNNEKIYKNKNNLINAWYNNTSNKSIKSSLKSKISNNISSNNRSKLSLTKSGSCQNMNPPPIEAIINNISPSNKTISNSNNQYSLTNKNINKTNKNRFTNTNTNTNTLYNNIDYTTTKPKHSSLNRLSNNNNLKNIPIKNINNSIKYNYILNHSNNYIEDESDDSKDSINYKINKLKNIPTESLIRLREFLISCDLLCYYNLLISKNLYHIDSYINALQEGITPLNYEDLEKIGIKKPGHIYRLLIKLDLDAGLIDNNLFSYINDKINYNSITSTIALTSSQNEIFCCGISLCPSNNNNNNYYYKKKIRSNAIYFNDLTSFLRVHDLVRFKGNFIHNGFDRIEFVIIQLFSKYSFNKKILNEYLHVYIDRDKFKLLNILNMVKFNIAKELGIDINEDEMNKIIYSSHKKLNKFEKDDELAYGNQIQIQTNNEIYNNESYSNRVNKKNDSNNFCSIF